MKRKLSLLLVLAVSAGLILGGCGQTKQEEAVSSAEAEEEVVLTQEQQLKQQISLGEGGADAYLALAALFESEGRVLEQRDALDICYRLFDSEEALEKLQNIVVNAADEEGYIKTEIETIYGNILTDNDSELIYSPTSSAWKEKAIPDKGVRNYYYSSGVDDKMYVRVGNLDGKAYTQIWYQNVDGKLVYLVDEDGQIKLIKTAVKSDGTIEGNFDYTTCDYEGKVILKDSGKIEGGKLSGDYSSTVFTGDENTDAFNLWLSMENAEGTTYKGTFGEDGKTTVTQPEVLSKVEVKEGQKAVAYAYNEGADKYLYTVFAADQAAECVFDISFIGVETMPEYETYTNPEAAPLPETVSTSDLAIRVFDGKVQWFDGIEWHSAGSVDELAAADPLNQPKSEGIVGGISDDIGGETVEGETTEGETTEGEEPVVEEAFSFVRKSLQNEKKVEEPKPTETTSSSNNGSTSKPSSGTSSGGSTSTGGGTTSKPAHTHSYSAATCTQAPTCSCGATNGSALGHAFNGGATCSRCGASNPNYVPPSTNGGDTDSEWTPDLE